MLFYYRFAFIEFETSDEALEALQESTSKCLRGKSINVQISKPKVVKAKPCEDNKPPCNALFVNNISYDTKADVLKNVVPNCSDARLMMDRKTKSSRG